MSEHKGAERLARIRKALVAAGAAGLAAFGAGLGEGGDWRAALGMAGAAALIAGYTTWLVPNRPAPVQQ